MSLLIVCIAIPLGLLFFGGLVLFIIWISRKLYKKQNHIYKYDHIYNKKG